MNKKTPTHLFGLKLTSYSKAMRPLVAEVLDEKFLSTLNAEEKEYLSKFLLEEYANQGLRSRKRKLKDSKKGCLLPNRIHKTKEQMSWCYGNTNYANRDPLHYRSVVGEVYEIRDEDVVSNEEAKIIEGIDRYQERKIFMKKKNAEENNDNEPLPVVTSWGIVSVAGGFMPVQIRSQGFKILETIPLEEKPWGIEVCQETCIRALTEFPLREEDKYNE
jgi:hypothetical protein